MTAKAKTEPVDEVLEVVPTAEPETQALKVMSAHRRLLIAQTVIDGMPFAKTKGKDNNEFPSVPIDAMRAAVRRACIEAGLIHRLEGIEYTVGTNTSGRSTMWTGRARLLFVNVDDPSDFVAFECLGCAQDNGDKGISKLETNLLKNGYKEVFDIGENGKDDIDAYSNEAVEAEADRIAANRAKSREKAQADPFFSNDLAPLRREVGTLMARSPGAEDVVNRYKAEHGPLPQWTRDVLEQCIAEAKGASE